MPGAAGANHKLLQAGFDRVIATHLEMLDDGHTTGKLSGKNCFGFPEKIRRLEVLLGPKNGFKQVMAAGREKKVDLIALSSHGHPRVGQRMLGSVTYKILHYADRPVFIVTPSTKSTTRGQGSEKEGYRTWQR